MWVVMAGVLMGGMAFPTDAQARHQEKRVAQRRAQVRDARHDDRYFRGRDVHVIREYYRPYYRRLPPRTRYRYYRAGYLPPGWARRIHRVPVFLERQLVVLPRGYRRGIIDGHVVVYNPRGMIVDVAVLF